MKIIFPQQLPADGLREVGSEARLAGLSCLELGLAGIVLCGFGLA